MRTVGRSFSTTSCGAVYRVRDRVASVSVHSLRPLGCSWCLHVGKQVVDEGVGTPLLDCTGRSVGSAVEAGKGIKHLPVDLDPATMLVVSAW